MLLELRIKNFVLIDSVDLKFSEGLNILTGETGAGKSIIIDSVNFIMGEKQGKDIIRSGEESAYVEGIFDKIKDSEIDHWMKEYGIPDDENIIISREINISGRSVSRINGKTVTVGILKEIGMKLLDIHGQHEHQSLLDERNHMHILDSFCDGNFEDIKCNYSDTYKKLNEIKNEISKLKTDDEYKQRKTDLLSYEIKEIDDAALKKGEDDELEREKAILSNSEKIYSALSQAYEKIYEETDGESAYDKIGTSLTGIESIQKYDKKIEEFKNQIEDVYYRLESVIEDIREYKENIEFNPDKLNDVETRLDLINKLKMKYGSTIEDILNYGLKCKSELTSIQNSAERINELEKRLKDVNVKLAKLAGDMSEIRKRTAIKLGQAIEKELKYLGMERAVFKVVVDEMEDYNESGKDSVAFIMTANIGEPLRPLSKVASGGELSRIMLAIKSVIADVDRIPTLIFDEIDTGISGRTAQSVAEKMCLISKNHQILCVTHLPQIASMADKHFKIEKFVKDNKTYTNVVGLDKNHEIEELARMLGGAVVTNLTISHSKEMKEMANSLKGEIRKVKYSI